MVDVDWLWEVLRRGREKRGFTQLDMAGMLGIPHQETYNAFEAGRTGSMHKGRMARAMEIAKRWETEDKELPLALREGVKAPIDVVCGYHGCGLPTAGCGHYCLWCGHALSARKDPEKIMLRILGPR